MIISMFILLNTISLCLIWVGISDYALNVADFLSSVCSFVFFCECILKITAY